MTKPNMALSSRSVNDTPALGTFVLEWISKFNDPPLHSITGDSMWKAFSDDFAKFTEDQFMTLKRIRKQSLKCFLYQRGVYINEYSRGSNNTLSAVLYECAQRQEPHEWTVDDLRRYSRISEVPFSWLEREFENIRSRRSINHVSILSPTPTHSPASLPPLSSPIHEQEVGLTQKDTNRFPQKQRNLRSYSKEISILFKLYKEELMYDGLSTGPFDYRLFIFYEMCNVAGVPSEAYLRVFSVMLKGMALSCFYSYKATSIADLTFAHVCDYIRHYFEGSYYQQANHEKWH